MISQEDDLQNQHQFSPSALQSGTPPSLSSLLGAPQDQGSMHEEHQRQQEPSNQRAVDQTNEQCPVKWMSSKMRLTRKLVLGSDLLPGNKQGSGRSFNDQVQIIQASGSNNTNSNPNNDIIRICSSCKTTKTPLWRGGPQGPKSLCNACGIRQMKARRAMKAAAGLTTCKMQREERRSDVDRTIPFKKRFKVDVTSASAQKKLRFDENTVSLSNKSAFQQTIPQEEKDAAVLLMAPSCGLIQG